jgi:replicative DNA helicase
VEDVLSFAQALEQAQEMHERALERGAVDGVPFGLKSLDALVGGAGRSDVVVAAGRPGMGKSAFALHVALHNARQGRRVVLFTLEMAAAQLASRSIAREAQVPGDALRRGAVNASQTQAARHAVPTLKSLPIVLDQTPGIDPARLRARLKRELQAGPVDLAIVDYLQLMDAGVRAENRVQEIAVITKALKHIAKSFDLPILLLSQLNRAVEAREDKRPQLADLRDSGTIEQDADAVILLFREQYYLEKEERSARDDAERDRLRARLMACEGLVDLIVAKNRHGPCGTAQSGFDGPLMAFHDLDERP